MVGGRLGESIGIREEIITKASSLAHKAHKYCSSNKPYLFEKSRGLSEAVFSFPGSWIVDDWYSDNPFGEKKVDLNLFPSLRSIGNDEVAAVNHVFYRRFEAVLRTSAFANEVKKSVTEKKRIVFTGHSSGGPTAMLATIWFLEEYIRPNKDQISPLCVTFGSPLVGDRIFPHVLRRENWDDCFKHFVMRYDIIPRVMFSSLVPIERELQEILHVLNPKSPSFGHASIGSGKEILNNFFMNVMTNASTVASHAACNLMGSTNPLLGTLTNFIELSPYRPFGTFIFCTGNGKLVVVKNPDAVLQILFYSCQLSSEAELDEIAKRGLKEHLGYENELRDTLEMQNVICLDHLENLPLSSNGGGGVEEVTINSSLNDLGLSARARVCLRAAAELQKQKQRNQCKINSNKSSIREKLSKIQDYRTWSEVRKIGYYDAFKIQDHENDFQANVKRLELAGLWDEVIEMLKRYELPDEFEGQKEWIELGTEYRRLVEPLDIANYYRHLKNEDTGPYTNKPRPKRYRYTQRWREHAERMKQGFSSESCFWAQIEELKNSNKSFEDMKVEILLLEKDLRTWFQKKQIGGDVFLDGSTFSKWWKMLPLQHRCESCLKEFMHG